MQFFHGKAGIFCQYKFARKHSAVVFGFDSRVLFESCAVFHRRLHSLEPREAVFQLEREMLSRLADSRVSPDAGGYVNEGHNRDPLSYSLRGVMIPQSKECPSNGWP